MVALLELVFPLALNIIIDDLLPAGRWQPIVMAGFILLAVYMLSSVFHFVVTYHGHKLGINIETEMRRRLFERVQRLSFRFFDNNKTGHLVSRMTNDVMDMGEVAHHAPEDLFIAVMTLLGALGIMLGINWQLAVLTFVIVPFMIGVSLYFSRKMNRAFRKMFEDIGNYNARVENNVSGMRVVQAFANEPFEIEKFKESNEQFRLTKLITYKVMAWHSSISFIMLKFVSLFVIVCGAWFVLEDSMSYGDFVAFVLLSNVFLGPIRTINAMIETIPKGLAGFKRYEELLQTESDVKERGDASDSPALQGEIEFRNVGFGYEPDQRIVEHLNLTIRAGESVALVGPSGGGKTTICSLLPRFYDVDEGQILIDGTDIRELTLRSLRGQIGIVQQDVFLFDGTVRDNIEYARLGASETEVWHAAERAQLADVIRAMPRGLDTMIGERGVKLSGGQKQRLSIARIFLKNPPILILDEATSALDTETEASIQQALAELAHGRTTLVIAHRLATVRDADRILVIANQGIAEQGTHEQLLERGGLYRRLHGKVLVS
ncbi:ABC transporter ATP-binding protein [Paenibacillus sp. IB182496]|uniref:ABC transporter ATP-binding protein n=2 Tax=Paenibacillus sabuli TaxID=2772509 RepID=A0A927BVB8_9BACL|nr:ABC transporter ATP-binding protein [Paenibacillus sabuli]